MSHDRITRVNELILKEIADLIIYELHDPRIKLTSITKVDISSNLRHAMVYISTYGDQKDKMDALEGLKSSEGFIWRELRKRLSLKFTPKIEFTIDTSIEYSIHMAELMASIKDSESGIKESESDE